jgi:excinuclease ABC subunit C
MLERPPGGAIPDSPGSYQFRDKDGRVIYVGKAKSLRQRLSNYFQSPSALPPRTAQMVACAESVEWIQVRNDVEALMLEYSLIKQHKPRFNVRLRDDKSYPFLVLTKADEWPRATVRRGRPSGRTENRYFGPFAHAYAIRETLDLLLRTFPVRSCSDSKFTRHERVGRPCLMYHIERCAGPCAGLVDHEQYSRLVDELSAFLEGDTAPVVRKLEGQMRAAAANLEFELAARARDRLAAVRKAVEKQQMVTERAEDLDCFAMAEDELEAAVQVFYVRRGRVVGRKGFIVDKVEDLTPAQLLADVLEQHYADAVNGVPPLVLVPGEVDELDVIEEWLSGLRADAVLGAQTGPSNAVGTEAGGTEAGGTEAGGTEDGLPGPNAADGPEGPEGPEGIEGTTPMGAEARPEEGADAAVPDATWKDPDASWKEWWAASGRRRPERSVNPRSAGTSRAHLHVPQRGEKKALLEMVSKNAKEELMRHRLRRSTDHNARARALNALQDALDLPEAPLRIECYDMSHLQGTDYVGSMVVMEDGLPRPGEYKRFKVRNVPGNDDYAAMEEVLTRRLTAYLEEKELPVGDRKRRFAYPPQLLLVDGGKGQLNVAIRVLEDLGLEDEIPVAALAKQFEEVYLPGMADPVRIPRGSEALYLLQQVRDEAHRFAITYHRKLRDKRMTVSALDGIPGLGPARRKRLLRELGSLKAVREASKGSLEALPWLPQQVVEALWEKLHGRGQGGRTGPGRTEAGPTEAGPTGAGAASRLRVERASEERAAEERAAEETEALEDAKALEGAKALEEEGGPEDAATLAPVGAAPVGQGAL